MHSRMDTDSGRDADVTLITGPNDQLRGHPAGRAGTSGHGRGVLSYLRDRAPRLRADFQARFPDGEADARDLLQREMLS
jgi:hypothetical protein